VAELCRREGISPTVYYRWSKDFLEAGKNGPVWDTRWDATADEVRDLKAENGSLRTTLPKRMTVTPVERHCDPRFLHPTRLCRPMNPSGS
jgi:transposase-like protein